MTAPAPRGDCEPALALAKVVAATPSASSSDEARSGVETLTQRASEETAPVCVNQQMPDVEVPARARPRTYSALPRTYSASYKARILAEYESLDKAGRGALLRREGLYTSLISAWRKQPDDRGLIEILHGSSLLPADKFMAIMEDAFRRGLSHKLTVVNSYRQMMAAFAIEPDPTDGV